MPQLEKLSRQMEDVHHDADKIDRVMVEVNDLKAPLQNTTQYLQQVSGYLNALDSHLREKFGDADDSQGFRKA